MAAVATIQRYQDSLHAWETRSVRRATRDDTVTEVVGLLDDERAAVRVEAVRALATLGAVDQLPRLIRMLGDEDEAVVAAVRAALDRLNAQQAEEGDG